MHDNTLQITVISRSETTGSIHCVPDFWTWEQWLGVAQIFGLDSNASCDCD